TPTSRTHQRRKEARPGELADAALDLLVERGFAATRLDDVAAAAGVSKGTLYLYFDSKEALFRAVVEQNILPVIEDAELIVADHQGSAAELLAELMRGWWQRVGATKAGGVTKLIVTEARNFPDLAAWYHDAVVARAKRLICGVLELGIQRGEFRALDVGLAFHAIFAPVMMLMIWRHSIGACCGQGIDPDEYIELSIDLILNGLKP
ncbi:MAG TPA: TetR/AcrR family transcriptional regulator, partial [Rhodocyclaceae bacterium]